MAIFIEGCNVDFDGDIITCIPIRNRSHPLMYNKKEGGLI